MKKTPAPPKVSSDHLNKLEVGKIVKAFMESVRTASRARWTTNRV